MKEKKQKFIELIIVILVIIYYFLCLFPSVFFKYSYKVGDLEFYYDDFTDYGIETEEQMEKFYLMCDEIATEAKNNPFYCSMNIKIVFCDSYGLFTFLNPTASKSLGTTLTFFNYSMIVLSKSDFSEMTIISSAKENNKRNIKTVLQHEITHSFLTKTISLINRITIPTWKEEGVCEVVSNDSTYDINEGIERLLSNKPDSSNSYKYFTYRMCVLYMMKYDGLSFDEVIKDKRKQKEILSKLQTLSESELKNLFE